MEELSQLYQEALEDYRARRLEDAAAKLFRVIAIDADFEDAYEALSVIFFNQKRYNEAVDVLKKWLALNPHSVMCHTNLSRCYAAQGMILEAEQEQAEARRLTWKADLKAKKHSLPKADYASQIARFKKVIAYDPHDVLGYFSLGTAHLDGGDYREAVDTFEKAIAVDSRHSSSYLGLGLALEALGELVKAKDIYLKGMRVAGEAGDLMPLRKMESRLRALEDKTR